MRVQHLSTSVLAPSASAASTFSVKPPQFPPRLPVVVALERNDAVERKRGRAGNEQAEQAWKMRVVAGEHQIPRLVAQAVAHPRGRIVGLQIAGRRELRERVAGPPEDLGRLLRAQFPAVPDNRGLHTLSGRSCRQPLDRFGAGRRERSPWVDLGSNRVAVMDQEETHYGVGSLPA